MATILAKLGETEEIRLSTDLLMVNPNSGFKWHQDNQNGPVLFDDALRWWVTMDDTPAEYGAPVYLKGSHKNKSVKSDAGEFGCTRCSCNHRSFFSLSLLTTSSPPLRRTHPRTPHLSTYRAPYHPTHSVRGHRER